MIMKIQDSSKKKTSNEHLEQKSAEQHPENSNTEEKSPKGKEQVLSTAKQRKEKQIAAAEQQLKAALNLRNCLTALQQSTSDERQQVVMDQVTAATENNEQQHINLQELTMKPDAAESIHPTPTELTHTEHKTEITHNNSEAVVETVKRDEESDNKGDERGEVTQMKEESFGEQMPDASAPPAVGNKSDWQAARKSQVSTLILDAITMDKTSNF